MIDIAAPGAKTFKGALKTPMGRIAQMGTAFAISNIARGGIALVTSLVVARGLGQTAFGRWVFCNAWASTLTVALALGCSVFLTP